MSMTVNVHTQGQPIIVQVQDLKSGNFALILEVCTGESWKQVSLFFNTPEELSAFNSKLNEVVHNAIKPKEAIAE